jgi:ribulose-phosphate 3-epimerase
MTKEIRITPSILNADFSRLNEEIDSIAGVSDLLHLDVMDNIFVPNFTFDFEAASKIINESSLAVDAHLMVSDVDLIAVQYAELGCASVTIHAEATENIPQTLKNIRRAGSRSSLGIKPNTKVEQYAEFIDDLDMFLIMEKVRTTRKMIGDRPIWLQVDGGISLQTIEIALEAGADTFVVGSAVFNAPDPAQMVLDIRKFAASI